MAGKSQRPGKRAQVLAVENHALTRVEYTIRPLDGQSALAVHYRVRRLFFWGRWIALRNPTFYSRDAARRFLGEMLRGKAVAIHDPVVRELYESEA